MALVHSDLKPQSESVFLDCLLKKNRYNMTFHAQYSLLNNCLHVLGSIFGLYDFQRNQVETFKQRGQ